VPFGYHPLNPFLNFLTKMSPIGFIDSPVHKAEAIRWTDDGIARYVEN